jgi:hypothetical protein
MASVIRGSGSSSLGGNLDIEGVLTYEDVTSVDSIGIVTARSGINVGTGTSISSPADNTLVLGTNDDPQITVDGNGRLLINTTTSRIVGGTGERYLQLEGSGFEQSSISLTRHSSSANGAPNILLGRSRGTSNGDSTTLQNGDKVGALTWAPADGNDIGSSCASVEAFIDGNVGLNSTPGALTFKTTSSNAATATERLRISSTGQVGIGTDFVAGNPYDAKLSVEGVTAISNSDQTIVVRDSNNDDAIGRGGNIGFEAYVDGTMRTLAAIGGVKEDTGTSFDGNLVLYTRRSAQANLDERLRIISDGSVGIGVTNPDRLLHLESNGNSYIRLTDYDITAETDSAVGVIEFETKDTQSAGVSALIGAYHQDTSGNSYLRFDTGNSSTISERLRITHDGKVGIGTDNPSDHLEILPNNGSGLKFKTANNTFAQITSDCNRTGANSHLLAIEGHWNGTPVAEIALIAGTDTTNKDDGQIIFRTSSANNLNSNERLRITSAGLVGIGTDNPNTLLHINGTTSTQKFLTLSAPTFRNNYIGVREADNLEIAADEDNEGDDSSIRFRVDGTEVVRIESGDFSGAIGPRMMLGTATDRGAMLHIAKNRGFTVIQNYLCIADGLILKYIADSRLDATQRQRFTFVGHSRDSAIITISVVGRRGGTNNTGQFDAAEWKARVFSTSTQVTTLAGQGVQWTSGFTDSHFIFTDNGGYGYTIDIDNPTSANDCDLSYHITIQNAIGNQHRLVSTDTITE